MDNILKCKCIKASVANLGLWCSFLREMVQVLLSRATILRQRTAVMQGEICQRRGRETYFQPKRQVHRNAVGKQDVFITRRVENIEVIV